MKKITQKKYVLLMLLTMECIHCMECATVAVPTEQCFLKLLAEIQESTFPINCFALDTSSDSNKTNLALTSDTYQYLETPWVDELACNKETHEHTIFNNALHELVIGRYNIAFTANEVLPWIYQRSNPLFFLTHFISRSFPRNPTYKTVQRLNKNKLVIYQKLQEVLNHAVCKQPVYESGLSPFEYFPHEMIPVIVGFLPCKDLLTCKRVSKQWKKIARRILSTKVPTFMDFENLVHGIQKCSYTTTFFDINIHPLEDNNGFSGRWKNRAPYIVTCEEDFDTLFDASCNLEGYYQKIAPINLLVVIFQRSDAVDRLIHYLAAVKSHVEITCGLLNKPAQSDRTVNKRCIFLSLYSLILSAQDKDACSDYY